MTRPYSIQSTVTGRLKPSPMPPWNQDHIVILFPRDKEQEALHLCQKQMLHGWKGFNPFLPPKGKRQMTPRLARRWRAHALKVLPDLRAMAALLGQDFMADTFDRYLVRYTIAERDDRARLNKQEPNHDNT